MENQLDIQGFASGLRWVRRQDGDPSYRVLQRKTEYSPSSISRVLSGKSFPRWEFTEKFLRACHVGEQEINGPWRNRWIEVAGLVSPLGDDVPADLETAAEAPAPLAHPGTECAQCGALVVNQIRHQAWHAAYAPREPRRTDGQPLRSLPG